MIRQILRGALMVLGLLPGAYSMQACTGCTPLTDLGPGLYLGSYEGGLYSAGLNLPPPAHQVAADGASASVVPRDASGAPDPTGRIAFVSISMSNCNQEFSAFERRADLDEHRAASLTVFNGAESNQAMDVISNPNAGYWNNLAARLLADGISPAQVQVVWIKVADLGPASTVFPDHANDLKANTTAVLQILKSKYPNLAIAYLSSRVYGGNSPDPLRSEPLSYETGFAVKWLIEAQIAGAPALNHDPLSGPVVAPVVIWGPYLWANGTTPRLDGLVWLPADFEGDGVHPSPSGEQKVAALLEELFHGNASHVQWFGKPTGARLVSLDAIADARVDGNQVNINYGSSATLNLSGPLQRSFIKFDLTGIQGTISAAKLSLMAPATSGNTPGTQLQGVSDTSWQEGLVTFTNAPAIDGQVHGQLPKISRGAAVSFDVLADVLASPGGLLSFALLDASGQASQKRYLSREGGGAPRLVLTLEPPCDEPGIPYCRSLENSSGQYAELSLSGTASITSNNLVLQAYGLPSSVPALTFYGFASAQVPFGEGLLCVSSPLARLNPASQSTSSGVFTRAFNWNAPPLSAGPFGVTAGDTVYFQCWYRDVTGGPAGFNLSDGTQVLLCP